MFCRTVGLAGPYLSTAVIKIPASLHVGLSGVCLAMTAIFGLAALDLVLSGKAVPNELWALAGGSLMQYAGLKTMPHDGDPQ
jgi:hypothetical protein